MISFDDTEATRSWLRAARSFQEDKCEKFQSRAFDKVAKLGLQEKIDDALSEIELKSVKVGTLIEEVLGDDQYYLISIIYVHFKVHDDNPKYGYDVVFCVMRDSFSRVWIDSNCRTYKSWSEYLDDNLLPKGFMYYPKYGKYEAGCEYEARITPAGQLKAVALDALDNAAQVVSTVADIATVASVVVFPVFGLAALGRTVLKKVVKRALVASVISNGFITTRNVQQLADRYQHRQSITLSNAEARELWINAGAHGFRTVTAGMSLTLSPSALTAGSTLLCRTARSAIVIGCGLTVFRENLILALDACYTDSSYGEMCRDNFIKKCRLYFNIVSPHHEFVKTLKAIKELTSSLKIIGKSIYNHLKLVGYQIKSRCGILRCQTASYIKELIHIGGKFIMNISFCIFESLINDLKGNIKHFLLTGDVRYIDLVVSRAGKEILSAFQPAWNAAKDEIYNYGTKKDVFKRMDLDDEDIRMIFSMLHDIEERYKLGRASKQEIINKMNVFLSKLTVQDCTTTEYIKRVKGFYLFLKKEVEIKMRQQYEEKIFMASLSDEKELTMDNDALRTDICRRVIENFNVEKCVEAYNKCSSSSNVASVEASGITMYVFVKYNKTSLNDSEYLNILEEKTSGKYNFDNAVPDRRGDRVLIESIDGKAVAIFYTELGPKELKGVLICTEK